MIEQKIKAWEALYGRPSIIITCRCNNFQVRGIYTDVQRVCLPDIVWPHNTLYLENVMARERIQLTDEEALDRNYSINGYGDR